ncbi:MAG: SDR family NAD(P)-dependent oxidoreductase [Verrucomicrobiae bacterium]|nr:SDR family NAD(P)-dependent oxidoreductase [Verrucomicrobiae bacterium]
MQNALPGKVVIVTGASSGIGLETARAFAQRGAIVVPASRRSNPPCDVTKDEDVQRLVSSTVAQHGRIDILVNNAGIGMRAAVADAPMSDVRYLMEVNFFGALRCIQAVLPVMKQQRTGQIVNVGSVLSLLATPRQSAYCASKFALRALTDALRLEVARDGIDVILIMPGYTDTPFFDNMYRYGGPPRITSLRGQHPAKVAAAIVRACERRQREVVLTFYGRLGTFMKRFFPRLLDWALIRTHHQV